MKYNFMAPKMEIVSNLITDMTIRGATDDKLRRAIEYSMAVINSEKAYM